MNTDNEVSTTSSSGSVKFDGVSDQFPVGLRVLVVDKDLVCLKILEILLRQCFYKEFVQSVTACYEKYSVTTCSRAMVALALLRERKGGFDLVISDVYLPDMDGFKLLEHIGLEMDLPVIMMSADDCKDFVMKGVTHGACDYLIKPVRLETIKNIWQHVFRKRRNELKELEHSGSMEDSDRNRKPLDDGDYACSANKGSWKHTERRKNVKNVEDEGEEWDVTSALKNHWSVELHQQFVAAVSQLGITEAVPEKILELMNASGLTREDVASHLQKYRLYPRRLAGFGASLMGGPEATFGSIPSLGRFDFQAHSVSGQLPQQNPMALQAGLGTNASMGMPIVDQMNFFISEVQTSNSYSKMRYGPGQPLSNNQVGFLPTTLEPKQLAHFHQPIQSFGSMGGLQISDGSSSFFKLPTQLRSAGSSHGDTPHCHQRVTNLESNSFLMQMTQQKQQLPLSQHQNHVQVDMQLQQQQHRLPSGMEPQMLSNEVSGRFLGRNGVVANSRETSTLENCITNHPSFGVVSQMSSVDYPINHVSELP